VFCPLKDTCVHPSGNHTLSLIPPAISVIIFNYHRLITVSRHPLRNNKFIAYALYLFSYSIFSSSLFYSELYVHLLCTGNCVVTAVEEHCAPYSISLLTGGNAWNELSFVVTWVLYCRDDSASPLYYTCEVLLRGLRGSSIMAQCSIIVTYSQKLWILNMARLIVSFFLFVHVWSFVLVRTTAQGDKEKEALFLN